MLLSLSLQHVESYKIIFLGFYIWIKLQLVLETRLKFDVDIMRRCHYSIDNILDRNNSKHQIVNIQSNWSKDERCFPEMKFAFLGSSDQRFNIRRSPKTEASGNQMFQESLNVADLMPWASSLKSVSCNYLLPLAVAASCCFFATSATCLCRAASVSALP